jgi:hypothetical protein
MSSFICPCCESGNNVKFTSLLYMAPRSLTQERQSSTEHDASNVRLVRKQPLPLKPRLKSDKLQRATHVEAAASHKTLEQFYQTTRCHNPEDSNGHSRRCVNLKCIEMVRNGRRPYVTWPQARNKPSCKRRHIGSGRNTWRFCNKAVNGTVGVGNLSFSALLAISKAFQLPWSAGL